MADIVAIKYRAFLSYSHHDKAWAQWLHASLESYRIDKHLVGRATALGPVPNSLRPIFCDRNDFSAGHSLSDQTLETLGASRCLVVVCSPSAVASKYVNEEIRQFKALGGARQIIPIIVDGEPGNAEHECFPPALRFKVSPDGALTDIPEEPIAADARAQGDGKKLALLKVVTGLIGLNLDEVVRRAEIARRHRNRVLTGLGLVLLALSVLAGGGGFSAYWYRSLNAQNQDRTVEWANNENKKIEDQKLRGDATVETLLSSLSGLEKLVNDNGGNTSKGRYVKAQILIILASAYQTLGKTDESLTHAQDASKILSGLLAEQSPELGWRKYLVAWYENLTGVVRPSRPDLQNQLSIAYQKMGDSLLYRDHLAVARDWYNKSLDLAQLLQAADPNNAEWQRGLSRAYDKIGDASKAFGNLAGARTDYENSLAIRIRLAERDPKPQAQRDLASVYDRLAEILRLQDRLAEALELEQRSRGIVAGFLTADASNNDWRRNLALNDRKLADIHRDMGELSVALAGYDESFAIIKQLNARDPKNTEWRGDVADWHVVIGDLCGKQGELGKAEENFRSAVTVLEELARSDPNNTQWQRALAQAYDRLATMLGRQAYAAARSPEFNLPAAGAATPSSSTEIFTETLLYYAKSLEIRQTLAAKDPENLKWQSDLGASHANLGTVRWTQGRLAQERADFELATDMFKQARKEFEFARDMFQQVCMAEPDNLNCWQRDLALANQWLTRLDGNLDDRAELRKEQENPDPVASGASLAGDGR